MGTSEMSVSSRTRSITTRGPSTSVSAVALDAPHNSWQPGTRYDTTPVSTARMTPLVDCSSLTSVSDGPTTSTSTADATRCPPHDVSSMLDIRHMPDASAQAEASNDPVPASFVPEPLGVHVNSAHITQVVRLILSSPTRQHRPTAPDMPQRRHAPTRPARWLRRKAERTTRLRPRADA